MITSKSNETFKYLKKLKQNKYRKQYQEFLVFGDKLIEEALKAGIVKSIITSNEFINDAILISKELMQELNYDNNNFDIVALCTIEQVNNKEPKYILVLEDIQDPDNVGALFRSALAFNFDHIILTNKTANIYNDKVIRASAGAVFHLTHEYSNNIFDKIKTLKKENYKIYITDTKGNTNINKPLDKAVLVLGNEGQGVSQQMKSLSDESLTINTSKVESLNVAVAGAILMYEWSK